MTLISFEDLYDIQNVYATWSGAALKVGSMISYIITAFTLIRFLIWKKYENF